MSRCDADEEFLHHLGGVTSDWAPMMDTTDIDEAAALLRPAFFPVAIAPCGMGSCTFG